MECNESAQLQCQGKECWGYEKCHTEKADTSTPSTVATCCIADSLSVEEKYNDLLMAVGEKHTDESRHETAKRYILDAEKHDERSCEASSD